MVNSVTENTIENKLCVSQAIDKGLSFLDKAQLPDGGFTCLVSQATYGLNEQMIEFQEGDRKGWVSVDNATVFPATMIGFFLTPLQIKEKANSILTKIEAFLINQKKRFDLWNHYTSKSIVYKYLPHDIDDTCCALSFLQDRKRYKGKHDDIILANRNQNGLFFTWFCLRKRKNNSLKYWMAATKECKHPLLTRKHWNESEGNRYDIDAIVNANVISYLGERKETEQAIEFIIQEIQKGNENECDGYYKNPFAIYYFISRCYAKGIQSFDRIRELISEKVLSQMRNNSNFNDNAHDTALGICTLLNFNVEIPDLLQENIRKYFIETQLPSGAWPKKVFYSGGTKFVYGWGSEELTTGIVLEALQRLENYALNA